MSPLSPLSQGMKLGMLFSPSITIYEHHRQTSVWLKQKQSYLCSTKVFCTSLPPPDLCCNITSNTVAKGTIQKGGEGDHRYPLLTVL